MKIITSNIRFDNPSDGINKWDNRKSFLSELLLSHLPDIICTQEGKKDQLKEFESLLSGFTLVDHHRSWINERMYPCIYFKNDKYRLINSNDIWLSTTPHIPGSSDFESSFPRLMTIAELQEIKTGLSFWIINVHLDHVLESTRLEQIKVMIQELKKLNLSSFVLAGDFNQNAKTELQSYLLKNLNLIDPWISKEETSYHSFGTLNSEGGRIDWILLPQNAKALSIKLDKTQRQNLYPSDHFPVICEFNF